MLAVGSIFSQGAVFGLRKYYLYCANVKNLQELMAI
jgi:hypothetical protein